MEQRTEEWYQARCGVITASRFREVMSAGRGGNPSKTRLTYMQYVVAERITGNPQETFAGPAHRWGIKHEDEAVATYEWKFDVDVIQVGFIRSGSHPFCGASPDGLVDDGGLEIKCPNSSVVHLTNVALKELPSEYVPQVQGGMFVTEKEWWDFGSYDPRVPPPNNLSVIRVYRDEKYIATLTEALELFQEEAVRLEQQLRGEI